MEISKNANATEEPANATEEPANATEELATAMVPSVRVPTKVPAQEFQIQVGKASVPRLLE